MRILRGQSNLEVSSKGFALFVVGLVLATFVGGAVRTVLRSDQVHQRIVNELRTRFPKLEFQMGATEVLLSRGFWPGLGLKVKGLTVKQDVCDKLSFLLNVPEAVLPMDLLSLRDGSVRLGEVLINGGEIHLDFHECPKNSEDKAIAGEDDEKAVGKVSLHKSIVNPKMDWQALSRTLNGIQLKNFAITYEKSPTWKLMLDSAELAVSSTLDFKALIQVEKSLPFGTLIHAITLNVHGIDRELSWQIRTDFKEGEIQVAGKTNLATGMGQNKIVIRQVPVKDFMSEIFQMGFVERELKLKATWLSCAVDWSGSLEDYGAHPLRIQNCRVEGGYGRAELENAEAWMQGEWLREPAEIKISSLQIQPFLEAFKREVLPAVFSHLGIWSGSLNLKNSHEWLLDGSLQNAEIVFLNQSMHGKQLIERVHTRVEKVGHQVDARIDEIAVHEGTFAGAIQFLLSDDWRSGEIKADISNLQLSPMIQKLLVNGEIGPLALHGSGHLLGGELALWEGHLELPNVTGEGWHAGPIQLESKYKNNAAQLSAQIAQVRVDNAWSYFPNLVTIDSRSNDVVVWKDLRAKVDIDKRGGRISNGTGLEVRNKQAWKGQASWVREGDFEARISLPSGRKSRVFLLHGDNGNLSVEAVP